MPWLKYRHKFAHGKGSWQWRDLGLVANAVHDEEIPYLVETLAEEYNYSDKYRGIDYEIIHDACVPRQVVLSAIKWNDARFKEAERNARRLDEQLTIVMDCPECAGRAPITRFTTAGWRIEDCPTCGRANVFARAYQMRPNTKPCNDERCTRKRGHTGACKFDLSSTIEALARTEGI